MKLRQCPAGCFVLETRPHITNCSKCGGHLVEVKPGDVIHTGLGPHIYSPIRRVETPSHLHRPSRN